MITIQFKLLNENSFIFFRISILNPEGRPTQDILAIFPNPGVNQDIQATFSNPGVIQDMQDSQTQ